MAERRAGGVSPAVAVVVIIIVLALIVALYWYFTRTPEKGRPMTFEEIRAKAKGPAGPMPKAGPLAPKGMPMPPEKGALKSP